LHSGGRGFKSPPVHHFRRDSGGTRGGTVMNLEKGFKNPSKEYRSVPFWLWDGDLKAEEIVAQVREMREKGIGGFFIQAGLGLLTPYLSKEWMDAVKQAVQEAKRMGMDVWLYDENRWPSGFAGGIVPAKDPKYRQKQLVCVELPGGTAFKKDENIVKIFAAQKEGDEIIDLEDITEKKVKPDKLNGKIIILFKKVFSPALPWFNNNSYVDTLDPETTDAFIESTYEAYCKEVGNEFGRTIPGIFTDEPNYLFPAEPLEQKNAVSVPWTESFPQFFKKKHKYSILENLPSIFYDVGNYRKVRYDFWSSVTDLFVEAYTKKLYDWCTKHNLKLTGHYMDEDTCISQIQSIGAAMPHYEYMHIPGVDKLFKNIKEIVTLKQVASVAHQLGKERILCETFAGTGWNLSFEDQKWIANWAYVLGINLTTQCLMRYSMKGVRKRFYPPALHQQPWWKYYRILADYYARLSYILSQGKFIAHILVIHPIGSVWSLYSPFKLRFKARPLEELEELDRRFFSLSKMLLELHRDYDYGDEKLMEKHAKVEAGELLVGQMSYKIVIIPSCSTLRKSTLELLERFVSTGGNVIAIKPAPNLVDNKESERLTLKETLNELLDPDVQIIDKEGMEINSLYYQHREIGEKQVYFFANNERERTFNATIKLKEAGRTEEWNPETGEITEIPCEQKNGYTVIETAFPPAGARLIILDRRKK